MTKLKKENFTLTKLKYLDGKVDIHYKYTLEVDGESHTFTQNPISTVLPHPNFMAVLSSLKTRVAEIFFPIKQVEFMTKRIRVNGFDISGSEGSRKIKILAMLADNNESEVSLNTSWISLDGEDKHGNQEKLKSDYQYGIERAYAYLFEGEKAQLEIPFKEEDDTNEDNTDKE